MREGEVSRLLREVFAGDDPKASPWDGVLFPGAVLGRFELVRELGHGGFGSVWEARDRELGRRVALKAVLRSGKEGTDAMALGEAVLTARLSHPNIVALHDIGRTEQGPFLVMELLEGRSLRDVLQEGPLPPEEAIRVAAQAARGLAHAHGHGVLHGDLTPSNVFICSSGTVKLLDLGLAGAAGADAGPGADRGTPGFIAPERARGEAGDARSDLYSLGVTLHWMLAGRGVEPGTGAVAGAAALSGPPGLRGLVARLLEADPASRPRTAAEVAEALEALAPGGLDAAVREATERRRLRRAALSLLLLLAAGAIGMAASSARAERERRGLPVGRELEVRVERSVLAPGESSPTSAARFTEGKAGFPVQPATWHSSDVRVASVDSAGRVTARGPGSATITAFLGDASGSDSVAVVEPGWEPLLSSRLAPPPPGTKVVHGRSTLDAPVASFAFGRWALWADQDGAPVVPLEFPPGTDTIVVEADLRSPFQDGEELRVGIGGAADAVGALNRFTAKVPSAGRWRTVRFEGSLADCRGRLFVEGVDLGTVEVDCHREPGLAGLVAIPERDLGGASAWSNLRVFRKRPTAPGTAAAAPVVPLR